MPDVAPDGLAAAVDAVLREYGYALAGALDDAANRAALECASEVSAASPRRTGRYAGSWTYEKSDRGNGHVATVYNRNRPQLTHLLEHGHMKRGGTGRVPGVPHIAPAADRCAEEFPRRAAEAIAGLAT
ncbi:MAG: HK97 gp10 family phage protein [Coriobacteriales bacterium]|jgi:hypothetical protein|nr:HK97 gp10 family phage protein [Coriobacteriales bacterium]